jgi:hypothetical protein
MVELQKLLTYHLRRLLSLKAGKEGIFFNSLQSVPVTMLLLSPRQGTWINDKLKIRKSFIYGLTRNNTDQY